MVIAFVLVHPIYCELQSKESESNELRQRDIICQTIFQHCRTSDLVLAVTCCVKLRLSLLSNPDLKLVCFLSLSAYYSTYLFRQRLRSRLTALWRYINFVLLLLLFLRKTMKIRLIYYYYTTTTIIITCLRYWGSL